MVEKVQSHSMEFTLVNTSCKAIATSTSLYSVIILFSMVSSKQIDFHQLDNGTSIQHSSIGGFGKWDGLLIYTVV